MMPVAKPFPLHDRNMRRRITDAVRQQILGSPDTAVTIVYLDEQGVPHTESCVRARKGEGVVFDDALPLFFIEFEAQWHESPVTPHAVT